MYPVRVLTLLILCFMLAGHVVPLAAEGQPDIVGLSLGITLSEAEQKIKAADPAFEIKALKDAGVKLYFLACGTTDFLYEGSKALDKTLTEQGLDHIFYESDGGHVWANWRLYLNTFAPMLFK